MAERQSQVSRDEIMALINDTVDVLDTNRESITPGEKVITMACITQALATLRIGDEIRQAAGLGGHGNGPLTEALEEFSVTAPLLAARLRRLGGHESP